MRNALLPPVYSQFYNLGNNAVQMANLDAPMAMERDVNVHGCSFYLHTESNQLAGGSLLAVPYQTLINYAPVAGYQSTSSSSDIITLQSSMQSKKASVPEVDRLAMETRKRPIEFTNQVGGKMAKKEWQSNKRKKANSCEEHWHHRFKERISNQEPPKLQVPVRRSQKLSDKITALQKLVSPYGKTDTASVLQEASLYIKLIQQQIQNLFQMLSSSYDATISFQHTQEVENHSKLEGLRSRGLCLVPISLAQKITQEHILFKEHYLNPQSR